MHEGHRGRMIEKLKNYADSLTEHELLEVLLYFSIPRVNTNPIAHRLLSTFGSIDRVFDASAEDLSKVEGVGPVSASFLKCIGSLFGRYKNLKEDVFPRFYGDGFPAFLREYYRGYSYEVLNVWLLASGGKILSQKSFTSREENGIYVDPAEITKCIGDSRCTAIVLSHNHPDGTTQPSAQDDAFTKQCEMLFSLNNIVLLDHYIVGGEAVYSYYGAGKMAEIAHTFHVKKLLKGEK